MTEDEQILMAVRRCRRVDLYVDPRPLDAKQTDRYARMRARWQNGEPLQYILGSCEFYGLEFQLTPAVLIPRPETEILVERVIDHIDQSCHGPVRILDIGTGSGNIAVCLAEQCSQVEVTAVDISLSALDVARANAARYKGGRRVTFLYSDLFSNLGIIGQQPAKFDIIVSNPPYVASRDMETLPPDVRREPVLALNGGPDGLVFYRKIIRRAPNYLRAGGVLFLEIGDGQAHAVLGMLAGLAEPPLATVYKDLNQKERVIKAEWTDGKTGH